MEFREYMCLQEPSQLYLNNSPVWHWMIDDTENSDMRQGNNSRTPGLLKGEQEQCQHLCTDQKCDRRCGILPKVFK
ncbi:hypothetical protein AV530_002841 [Patagioenas fasciata monilis]|uniref:Uncharacterized protein n=1 Tax=Patagioenas fasciata monilis TaxID=372326 RepID=A0A1V4K9H8_PATFA|nr:hypothetical protein AV530_002841 [Patagioenas fasciata monilis]